MKKSVTVGNQTVIPGGCGDGGGELAWEQRQEKEQNQMHQLVRKVIL